MIELNNIKKEENNIIKWRRELHSIPELELELPNTVKYVEEELKKIGISYKKLVNGNAIVGLIESGKKGATIGIRADMDALPIREETELSCKSENGNMHACGHDAHTAMLLGAAKILNENKDKFKGNIKLLFQPGEEYPGGAKPMIEEGAMENPHVDAVIGLHNGFINPSVKPGCIGIKKGSLMASMDRFYIKVKGQGGHGAYPDKTVDSVAIAAEIVTALHKIVSREVPTTKPSILSVTQIHGGFNQNILPDIVEMEGTVRATDEDVRKFIAGRIEEVATGIAKSFRAEAEVVYDYKYPVVINNDDFTDFFEDVAEKVIGKERIVELVDPIMGGEDMAYFLQEAPGTFFFLSNPKDEENPVPHHNSKFDINEDYLYMGTALFVNTAIEYLNKEEI